MIEKMDAAAEKVDALELQAENTRCCALGIGKACHTGFLQIKEGMEKLRDELSEASGTLVDHTYHDGSCPA